MEIPGRSRVPSPASSVRQHHRFNHSPNCVKRMSDRHGEERDMQSKDADETKRSQAMDSTGASYDIVAMGRSSIDLYSNDIGAPFEQITSFAAYVGGCPTDISVGTRRLGLRAALLTAVGDDQVGNFILHFLRREGVETRYIPTKAGWRSSAVVLGIEPPDRFPLTYYRGNCADIALTIDDV